MKQQPDKSKSLTAGSLATFQILAATCALGAILAMPATADMYHPPATPGGLQVQPVIDGPPTPAGANRATIQFTGLEAPYMVQVSSNMVDWDNGGVTSLKNPNYSSSTVVSNVPSGTAFFRLMMLGATNWVGKWNSGALAVSNVFVGSDKCYGCHSDKVAQWQGTGHATALSLIMDTNTGAFIGHANDSCVVCHTTGKGQPGGFVSIATTPKLANVNCENCHGSANAHVNISGRQFHPVNTLAAETCGGCHNGSHHPTFDEWSSSGHAEVTPDVAFGASGMTNAGTVGFSRQMSCGPCHSGATRMAMLKNYEARQMGITNLLSLPSGHDAAEYGPTCVVCHDPHSAANVGQLRNPVRSTDFFTFFTGSVTQTNYSTDVFGRITTNITYLNDVFAAQYDPNVQVCAQCHNSRGARWDGKSKTWNASSNAMVLGSSQSFSRGPHHSPQYNILSGIVQDDYLNKTNAVSHPHRNIATQCVACHMPGYAVDSTTSVTGHTFALNVKGCALAGCHTSYTEEGLHVKIEEVQVARSNGIANVVSLLNQWATAKGPALFGANYSKYLQNGWEYQAIGSLATVTNTGPSSSDATKVPDAIKKARFNLYMVENDGSLGVHNPTYTTFLINDAETNVSAQFPSANFRAKATVGYAPFSVTFTNLGTGISTYAWNFGDGVGTSTSANPTYSYTTPGDYSVTFTADGTETLTRTAYIHVIVKPTVSFTASATSVPVNTPITFTNDSANISDVGLWRMQFDTTSSSTRVDSGFTPVYTYTYTNAGTYSVSLRATTDAGSTTTTKAAYITVTP